MTFRLGPGPESDMTVARAADGDADQSNEAPILSMPADRDDEPSAFEVLRSSCLHGSFKLRTSTQTVTCGACGVEMSPWVALLRIADEWDRLARNRDALRRQVADIRRRISALKREEQNAKTRVRRARGDG